MFQTKIFCRNDNNTLFYIAKKIHSKKIIFARVRNEIRSKPAVFLPQTGYFIDQKRKVKKSTVTT